MAERTIRHAGFVYHKPNVSIGPDGKKVTTWHPVMAYRNETVDIEQESDLAAGDAAGAFYTKDYYPKGHDYEGVPRGLNLGLADGQFTDSDVPDGDDTPDILSESDEEIAAWVGRSSVAKVVEAAGEDPEKAAKLIEAEETASGGDPRKTLISALDKIVGE